MPNFYYAQYQHRLYAHNRCRFIYINHEAAVQSRKIKMNKKVQKATKKQQFVFKNRFSAKKNQHAMFVDTVLFFNICQIFMECRMLSNLLMIYTSRYIERNCFGLIVCDFMDLRRF